MKKHIAFMERTEELQAQRLYNEEQRKKKRDKRKKHDWNALLEEYLDDAQPHVSKTEFFRKIKKMEQKSLVSKWFKQKTKGWTDLKKERVEVQTQIIKAKTVEENFNVIEMQQIDWIKEKARLASKIGGVIKVMNKGLETGDVEYATLINKAKNISLLVKIADEIYKETDEFIKEQAKMKALEEEEDGTNDVSFVVN